MNDPPFGGLVDSTIRHGSGDNRKSSSPTTHCSAATAAVSLYTYGTMPQPVSSSMSALTHFFPLDLCSMYSTAPSAVSVVAAPNITCPTSPLTSGCVAKYSAICFASECQGAP